MNITPIKWSPQFSQQVRRPRADDGEYGHVNGDLLFFIYQTSDPYCKGWRSWDKSSQSPWPEGATTRYRRHWNVWFYFGSNEQSKTGGLKNRASAKRVARRRLADKIRGMFCASNSWFTWTS